MIGETVLIARATDGTGELQTEQIREPYPDGATGYHRSVAHIEDMA
jgi:hypothetical protein